MKVKTAIRVGFLWLALPVVFCATGFAGEDSNRGAEKIVLNGGSRGEVPFPHRVHQNSLTECTVCHDLFEQKPGIIDSMKAAGELKKKQVMNKLCVSCHRQKKKAGEKGGPTSCSDCHKK